MAGRKRKRGRRRSAGKGDPARRDPRSRSTPSMRSIHELINERARLAQAGRHLQARGRPHGRFLPAGARSAGAAHGAASATEGSAARRGNAAAVPRDHVGLPRAGGAAEGGLPRPRGHLHAGGRAQALRPLGACAGAAVDRRSVPGGGGGHRGFRRGAGREFHRGHGQPHARHVPDSPLQDLRRGRAAHPPAPDGRAWTRSSRCVRVCAHPQSLAQCRGWLDEHLPDVERVAGRSNAEGARRARDEEGTAAIAGDAAAEVYGLDMLAQRDRGPADNTTRFLVVGRKLLQAQRATTRPRCWCRRGKHEVAGRAATGCSSRWRSTRST